MGNYRLFLLYQTNAYENISNRAVYYTLLLYSLGE